MKLHSDKSLIDKSIANADICKTMNGSRARYDRYKVRSIYRPFDRSSAAVVDVRSVLACKSKNCE